VLADKSASGKSENSLLPRQNINILTAEIACLSEAAYIFYITKNS